MSNVSSANNWLSTLIRQAIDENCCFRNGCTTCGAQKFGSLLMMALIREYSQLRVAGVQFGALHAELLSGAIADLSEEDLPAGIEAKKALEFLIRLAWCTLDVQGQERIENKMRSLFLKRILLKVDPGIGIRAQTAVLQISPSEWEGLGAELAVHGFLTPRTQRLLNIVESSSRMIPSGEQSLALLDVLDGARSRRGNIKCSKN